MTRSLRALALASASGLVLMAPWLTSPALAVCNTVGLVTTCTGNSGGGTVGLAPIGDGNLINNLGTLTGTIDGIQIDTNLNVVQNSGTISGGSIGVDIFGGSNTVNNTGVITGSTAAISMVAGNNHAVTNSGSIIATGGVGSFGISLDGISGPASNSSIVNDGSISAGTAITAVIVTSTVTNNGTLAATGTGISVFGNANTVTNNGTLSAAGTGISINGANNAITNNGTISVPQGTGISVVGGAFTIVNNGLIAVAGGTGISTEAIGTVVNNGTIRTVDPATGNVGTMFSIGSNSVTNNGVLDGMVSVGGTLINNGVITISVPGTGTALSASTSAIGTTHTAGTFQQTAAGVLVLRADMAGNHDSLQVTGTATLGGTLVLNLTPTFFRSRIVFANVVTATTFGGTQFATVAVTMPASPFIRVTTEYASPAGVVTTGASLAAVDDAVSVILNPVPFGSIPGLTPNQQSVGTALAGGCASPTLGGPGLALCTGVLFAPSVAVLDILSGEIASAVQNPSFMIGEQFLDAMFNQAQRRMPCGGGGSAGGRSSGRSGRFNAWASGFGSFNGRRDGDASGSARLNMTDGGGAAGVDMCAGPNLVVGIAFGGASSSFSLDGRGADGTTRAGLAGTYGAWGSGPFYVNLGLAYSRSDYSTTRNVAIGAFNERATGDFNGNQFASRLEAGFHFNFRGYSFRPFLGATGQVLRQSGFSETAINNATGQPGVTGLNTQGHTTNAPLPFMGAEASTTYQLGEWGSITPRLRLSWGHETSTGRQSTSAFQALQGASFTVNGAPAASNTANIRAGVDGDLWGLVEFYAQVDSGLAAGGNTFSASAGVRMAW